MGEQGGERQAVECRVGAWRLKGRGGEAREEEEESGGVGGG